MSWRDIFGKKAETSISPSTTGLKKSGNHLKTFNISSEQETKFRSQMKEESSSTNLKAAEQKAEKPQEQSEKNSQSNPSMSRSHSSPQEQEQWTSPNTQAEPARISTIETVELRKMHHRKAGDTERQAAELIAPRVTGLRFKVLGFIAAFGEQGAIGEDIAQESGEWLYSVKPRITELNRLGLVEDTGNRIKNSRNRKEVVWRITEAGKEILNAKGN